MAGALANLPAPFLYLRNRFGGDFYQRSGTVSVGTTLSSVVKNDPEAVALNLINLGSATVYVAPTPTVSTTLGIPIAGGGILSLIVRDDMTLPSLDWYAVSSSGTNTLYFLRLIRYAQVAG